MFTFCAGRSLNIQTNKQSMYSHHVRFYLCNHQDLNTPRLYVYVYISLMTIAVIFCWFSWWTSYYVYQHTVRNSCICLLHKWRFFRVLCLNLSRQFIELDDSASSQWHRPCFNGSSLIAWALSIILAVLCPVVHRHTSSIQCCRGVGFPLSTWTRTSNQCLC